MTGSKRDYNGVYRKDELDRIAFPLGGIGAGMVCLEGTGALSHVSLRHRPDVYNEPMTFAALHIKGARTARVLEGPVPLWKAFGPGGAGNGAAGKTYGLPRFADASFRTRFPFGIVQLREKTMPVSVELTGWSPFVPGDPDSSGLPVAALEYRFRNRTDRPIEAVFSFHAANFMRTGDNTGARIDAMPGGFTLAQPTVQDKPWEEGYFAAFAVDPAAAADCAWFRGGWWDPLTMVWNAVATGSTPARPPHTEGAPGNGGSVYVPFKLRAKAEKTICLLLAWYVPMSNIHVGADPAAPAEAGQPSASAGHFHRPWYSSRFASIGEVASFWRDNYAGLRDATRSFSDCFYDTTLPSEAIEAVAANLTILKSPTCLRQADGRFWGWEGCCDGAGCCHGSCTHVWNYAQAMAHLFPSLERSMRETEFRVSQDARGHQNFRASLPIREPDHTFHAAADGQLGGIMKVHREWRVSGDTAWMKSLWPQVRQSLDYCIATWDPARTGALLEPHHNTYDIEFWGADGMCTSFYLGALQAAVAMGQACGDDVSAYEDLRTKGRRAMETALWNGTYFIQKIQWKGLRAADPTTAQSAMTSYTPEALALLRQEGPKYQYGIGCLSDGVLGDWLARCSGVAPVLSAQKVARHVASVFRHNFRKDLLDHANPQRPGYALGPEAGLLLCSWPKGGKLSLPFVYSDEVWTGIEYQVAAHLIMLGSVKEGLTIVRAVRDRYDGRHRNPFNEYECGHWYARAMSSYGLLQALSGARYDAVEKTLYLEPRVKGDFRAFLATATGYGTVGVRKGRPFLAVRSGSIAVERIVFKAARQSVAASSTSSHGK